MQGRLNRAREAVIDSYCDASAPYVFRGWAIDRSNPEERLELEILLDGVPVRTVIAGEYREDLRHAGIGDGRHAFDAVAPLEAASGRAIRVQAALRLKGTQELVPGSSRTIDLLTAPLTFAHLREMADALLEAKMQAGRDRAQAVVLESRGLLRPARKIALFAVNARVIMASHRRIMTELRAAGYTIVTINSAERFGRLWLDLAGELAEVVLIKKNEGRDFSSWLTAFHMYRSELEDADHVLFVNESVFGPVRPLGPVLEQGIASGAGFWALSDSYEVRYHLQSSFFILTAETIHCRAFREFVAAYAYPDEKRAVIDQGEIALSSCLIDAGVKFGALCSYEDLCNSWIEKYDHHISEACGLASSSRHDKRFAEFQQIWMTNGHVEHWMQWIQRLTSSLMAGEPRNAQHVFWRLMIEEFGYPFIKRELLLSNPGGVPDLSALFGLISDEDGRTIISDMQHLAGRAPPLLRMPLARSVK